LSLEKVGLKWSMLATMSWDCMYETLEEYVQEKVSIGFLDRGPGMIARRNLTRPVHCCRIWKVANGMGMFLQTTERRTILLEHWVGGLIASVLPLAKTNSKRSISTS
jgi:hypothetical protein